MADPTYDVKNSRDLNVFLAGVLKDVRKGVISSEQADVISKVADKINKNNIVNVLHNKQINSKEPLEFFAVEKEVYV